MGFVDLLIYEIGFGCPGQLGSLTILGGSLVPRLLSLAPSVRAYRQEVGLSLSILGGGEGEVGEGYALRFFCSENHVSVHVPSSHCSLGKY